MSSNTKSKTDASFRLLFPLTLKMIIRNDDNPLGVTYTSNRYNSGRHYDARADYSNKDYEHMRHNPRPTERYGMPDEKFGHDVGRRDDDNYMGRYSRGDYESYRRYEEPNRRYDNDYRGGFNSRNYSDEGRPHYGEDTSYSNLERWQGRSDQRRDRYSDDRGNR